jgi:hypothetical protein
VVHKPQSREARKVDALLATASSRLLNAGALLNHMRLLHEQGNEIDYWRMAVQLGEHLTVGGEALDDAHKFLLGRIGIVARRPAA